jgi:hypothetical protein
MRLRPYYIKHMSAWLDLQILVETIHTVLAGHRRPAGGHDRAGGLVAGRRMRIGCTASLAAALPA